MGNRLNIRVSPHWQALVREVLEQLPPPEGIGYRWIYLVQNQHRAIYLKRKLLSRFGPGTVPDPPILTWEAFLERWWQHVPEAEALSVARDQRILLLWRALAELSGEQSPGLPPITPALLTHFNRLIPQLLAWQEEGQPAPMYNTVLAAYQRQKVRTPLRDWPELIAWLESGPGREGLARPYPQLNSLFVEMSRPLPHLWIDLLKRLVEWGYQVTVLVHGGNALQMFDHLRFALARLKEGGGTITRSQGKGPAWERLFFRPGVETIKPPVPVTIVRCASALEEARFAARWCKQQLVEQRLAPGRIAIVCPAMDQYLPLLRVELERAGVPIRDQIPQAASQALAVQHLQLFLELILEGEPISLIAQVLLSPFFSYREHLQGVPVEVLLRQGKVLAGLPALIEQLTRRLELLQTSAPDEAGGRNEKEVDQLQKLVAQLNQLRRDLAGFYQAQSLSALHSVLTTLVEKHGFSERFRHLQRTGMPESEAAHQVRALQALFERLDRLTALEATLANPVQAMPEQLAALFRWLTENTPVPPLPLQMSGVQLASLEEADSLDCHYLLVLGMSENQFPRAANFPAADLPESLRAILLEGASADYQRFVQLLEQPEKGLIFTFPAYQDENPLSPSTLLSELCRLSGLSIQPVALPKVPDEETVLALLNGSAEQKVVWELLEERPNLKARLQRLRWQYHVYRKRRTAGQQGHWDGDLTAQAIIGYYLKQIFSQAVFSASALDLYAQCPMKFFLSRLLDLEEPQVQEEWLTPLEKGLYIHRVLYRYYSGSEKDLEQLLEIAGNLFDRLPLPNSLLTDVERERFVGSDQQEGLFHRFWQAELEYLKSWRTRPQFFELPFGPFPPERVHYPDPSLSRPVQLKGNLGHFFLKGVVDRLEEAPGHGFLVMDYKTGSPPRFGDIQQGLYLQLPLYVAAMAQVAGDLGLPDRPLGGVIYQLNEKEVKRNLIFVDGAAPIPGNKNTPVLNSDNPDGLSMEQFLQQVIDDALKYVAGIQAGNFPHTTDLSRCARCPFKPTCRVDGTRF
ncbi:MAG: PD-(D/E)XK nuclease family protein [Calditrichaeota bacterium]|nr:MAG: PD-(D/E)XK nuclease family protein [Calditrichota bacterium]